MLKQLWTEFCTTTGIRGFSHIYRAKTLAEKVFWTLALAAFFSLTIWDVTNAVERYTDAPTGTKVTVFNNSTFNLGLPTICLRLKLRREHFKLDIINSSEVESFLQQFRQLNISNYIKVQTANYTSMDDNFTTLMTLIAAVISNVMRVGLYVGENVTTDDLQWGIALNDHEDKFEVDNETQQSIQTVYNFLNERGMKMRKLVAPTAVTICHMLNLHYVFTHISTVNGVKSETNGTFCKPQLVTWFGVEPFIQANRDLLCYRFPSEALTFYLTFEFLDVYFDKTHFDGPLDSLYLDMSGNRASSINEQNIWALREGFYEGLIIQLAGHFKPFPSPKSPCSFESSRVDCLIKCRADYIIRQCGCVPLFALNVDVHQTSCCDLDTFDSSNSLIIPGYRNNTAGCKNIPLLSHPNSSCAQKCYSSCEHKIYTFMQVEREKVDGNITHFWLNVDPFMYPVIEDIFLMEPRQFLGQLGGILSLWLGANFMVILHICVFAVSSVGNMKVERRIVHNSSEDLVEEKFIHMVEKRLENSQKYPSATAAMEQKIKS